MVRQLQAHSIIFLIFNLNAEVLKYFHRYIVLSRYCSDCKNDDDIVKAGESLKESNRKSKMPSSKTSSRDWGKGMATVGRSKVCSMPNNHFGPIPGIEVGTQ